MCVRVYVICSWKCEIWLIFFLRFFFKFYFSQTWIYAYISMCIQMWAEHTRDAELIKIKDFRICFNRLDCRNSDKHTITTRYKEEAEKRIVRKRDVKRGRERKQKSELTEEKTGKLAFGILLTLRARSGNHLFLNVLRSSRNRHIHLDFE